MVDAGLKMHFSRDGLVLRKILLTTHVANRTTRALCERVGFTECERVNSMYEDGITALIYGIDTRLN